MNPMVEWLEAEARAADAEAGEALADANLNSGEWMPLSSLRPGFVFETKDGTRGVVTAKHHVVLLADGRDAVPPPDTEARALGSYNFPVHAALAEGRARGLRATARMVKDGPRPGESAMVLSDARIAGAMTLLGGKAAFDRAPLIVESRAALGTFLRVRAYVGSSVVGDPLEAEELEALVLAEHAIRLAEPWEPVSGAACWVFRPHFEARNARIAELSSSGFLVGNPILLADGAIACLVREPNLLRDRWASEASADAAAALRDGHAGRACNAAKLAFVLDQTMSPEQVAMLALAHERSGNPVRAQGYMAVAKNTHGEDFAARVAAGRAVLERALLTPDCGWQAADCEGSAIFLVRIATRPWDCAMCFHCASIFDPVLGAQGGYRHDHRGTKLLPWVTEALDGLAGWFGGAVA